MHNLSLVLFTCLAQAAVGMVAVLAFSPARADAVSPARTGGGILLDRLRAPGGYILATALVLFGLGVLFSLLHLSDPLISFYSITNVASSWLSREILFVGLFGLCALALFFLPGRLLAVAAALFGLGLLYVMSMVYMTPPVPFWKSSLTFWLFLSTAFLLGSATVLCVRTVSGRNAGMLPLLVAVAAMLRLGLGLAQIIHGYRVGSPAMPEMDLVFLHAGGIGLGLVILFIGLRSRAQESGRSALPYVAAATILFWAAEILARISFYEGLSSFTM